jgi:uncharacterized protein YndB with AHSA1/START domain
MSSNNDQTVFTITRQFKQPLGVVWAAWSEPDQLKQWWGPQGCSVDVNRFEFRPGGFVHYTMNFVGVPKMWGRFNYREIAALKRIVWLNSFANEHGGIARAPFSEICPLEVQNTVTFAEQAGQTTVTLHAEPFGATDAERQYFEALQPSLEQGYGGTFEQLGNYLLRG